MKLSEIFDFIFTRFALFAAAFVWTRFYVRNLVLSIFIALIATAIASVILHLIFKRGRRGRRLSREREQKMKDSINQFLYGEPTLAMDFFHNMLCGRHKVDKDKSGLVIDEDTYLYIKLSHSRLSISEVCAAVARARAIGLKKIVFFAHLLDKDAQGAAKLFADFVVEFYGDREVFALMERYDTFPPVTVLIKPPRPRLKDILPAMLCRERAKSFLTAAVFLAVGSVFLPYTVYYAISSSVLLVLAVISLKEPFRPRPVQGDWL